MTPILRIMLILTLLGSLNGCASWFGSTLQEPEIQLLRVDVQRARLTDQRFDLYFRIDNPNPVRLPVRGMLYSLHLNEMKLAAGESTDWFTVPAYGRHTFKVPVRTNLWRHLKKMVRLFEKPDQPIRYQLQAQIRTGLLFGHEVQVSRDGEIIPGNYIPE